MFVMLLQETGSRNLLFPSKNSNLSFNLQLPYNPFISKETSSECLTKQ